jgi:two-component system OmpR family sensor kinase
VLTGRETASGDTIHGPGGPGSPQKEPHGAASGTARQTVWGRWLAGRTLRTRLIAGLLVLFTLASVGVGFATTIALHGFLVTRLDQQLLAAGIQLPVDLEHDSGDDGNGAGPGPRFTPPPGQAPGTLGVWLRGQQVRAGVQQQDGKIATPRLSGADLGKLAAMPTNGHPYTVSLSALGDYRMRAVPGQNGDVLMTGLPTSSVEATVQQLELIEAVVFGAALLLMGMAGTGWIRLSLRPLGRVTKTAAEVAELPLESGEVILPHRVPDADPRTEVGKLGKAFNQMLGHVEQSLATRQATEARLRQFIADASHELRTPLAGIRGYTELAMRSKGTVDADLHHVLGRVDAESARMSRLVDDLLLLARLDAGRPLAHEQVDLTRLAIDATNDARVADPRHRWVLDLPDQSVVVTGDEHRLHQVLANLLTNARTHTPRGTTVTVHLARERAATNGGGVELTVSDDGPGIPVELQGRVWERFARGDSTRSRKAGSTGLGLAIVQAVVAAHHGHVTVTSRPGLTTFRIWLPSDASANGAGDGQAQA